MAAGLAAAAQLYKLDTSACMFITDVNITYTCAKAGYAWMPCYTTGGGARATINVISYSA